MTARNWSSVPDDKRSRWYEIFGRSRNGSDVEGECPVCGERQLHRYYQVGRPVAREVGGEKFVAHGGLWEWCSACRSFEHSSALVPAWWKPDLRVDESRLTAIPDVLEAAVQARHAAPTAARRVSVVEFRCMDPDGPRTMSRFVLTADGTVATVGPTQNSIKVADETVAGGLPGPGGTYVKRDAGMEFLRLLAPNFAGSAFWATNVHEMDEDEAMTAFPKPPKW